MKKVGIIAEYNPFHNGHIYHIEKTKELYPDSTIILVLSGNFSQRGIPSIINKWDKTKIALQYGVDLVVELPFPFATQSADVFARASVTILKELKAEVLVFGSEENNPEKLKELATIQTTPEYEPLVQSFLKKGENYPTAMNKALKKLGGIEVTTPNDLLGLSYIKEINRQNANIEVKTIKRTNSYHEQESKKSIASASSIRNSIQNKKDISQQVPIETLYALTESIVTMEDLFPLLRYKIYTSTDLTKYLDVEEGIENRIQKAILKVDSYQALLDEVKTKRYTYSRLSRMFTHILCNFTKEEKNKMLDISYIRILGFNKKGQHLLKSIKKEAKLPIYTKFTPIEPLLLELRATKVYASTLPYKVQQKLIQQEYKNPPIIK